PESDRGRKDLSTEQTDHTETNWRMSYLLRSYFCVFGVFRGRFLSLVAAAGRAAASVVLNFRAFREQSDTAPPSLNQRTGNTIGTDRR
ncbi:MAG: hypothetical protein ACT4QC_15450, partial [Planctomycetaceae bacterium]